MFNWMRWLPHPGYKKCGGASRDCSLAGTRDWMDEAFKKHDEALNLAEKAVTPGLQEVQRRNADWNLGKALRAGDPRKLGLWGRLYRFGAMMVFRV